jgi:hypothetical protein
MGDTLYMQNMTDSFEKPSRDEELFEGLYHLGVGKGKAHHSQLTFLS